MVTIGKALSGKARRKKIRDRNKRFIIKYKKISSCVDCSTKKRLQFHHTRDKKYAVSEMVFKGKSLSALKEEIRKCVVVCKKCHIARHLLPDCYTANKGEIL